MKMFWRLMARSVIFSGLIALSIIITICIIACRGQEIPPVLVNFGLIVLTFFFTSKSKDIQDSIDDSKRSN